VLLLPHGYEGQGPEHSSARFERFLQLCAENNMQVVNATTAAQYFHLLRRQARQEMSKPLVVVAPKSLLRLPEAASAIDEFTRGGFHAVISDAAADASAVQRVLLCSGKVYYDLAAERKRISDQGTAIVRLEQFYPFPKQQLVDELSRYAKAADVCWVQEEPQNYGGWFFVEPRLRQLLGGGRRLRYAGRPASASTATGSHTLHMLEQQQLVKDAFTG
jgi:2-oxoglutarate dehydrogenase complex dehydrogenase (E1) component-like enzyme